MINQVYQISLKNQVYQISLKNQVYRIEKPSLSNSINQVYRIEKLGLSISKNQVYQIEKLGFSIEKLGLSIRLDITLLVIRAMSKQSKNQVYQIEKLGFSIEKLGWKKYTSGPRYWYTSIGQYQTILAVQYSALP